MRSIDDVIEDVLQGARYLELAEGRSANRAFLYGWLGRIMP